MSLWVGHQVSFILISLFKYKQLRILRNLREKDLTHIQFIGIFSFSEFIILIGNRLELLLAVIMSAHLKWK